MEQNKDHIGAAVRGEAVALREALDLAATWIENIKPEELELWRDVKATDIRRVLRSAPVSARAADAPSEPMSKDLEWLIQCADEARTNPELATTLRNNVKNGVKSRAADALDSQPTDEAGLPPLPDPIEVGGEGWDFEDFQSEKTFSCEHMWAYARAAIASSQPTDPDGWISVKDRLPEPGVLVMVWQPRTTMNHPDDILINFDCIDPEDDDANTWQGHNNWRDEVACIAKPPGSIIPPHDAPYTHWQTIPADPASSQPTDGGVRNG